MPAAESRVAVRGGFERGLSDGLAGLAIIRREPDREVAAPAGTFTLFDRYIVISDYEMQRKC